MDKRKSTAKKLNKSSKYLIVIALLLLLVGGWISTTNAFTYLRGYFLFKSEQFSNKHVEEQGSKQVTNTEENKENELYPVAPKKGDKIGSLYIPKLETTLPIYHGSDEEELEKGIGHFAGSVMPGEEDNSVLSGHRDTIFRRLGEVGKGDLLVVTTTAGEFTYKVKNVRIVEKNDRSVIVPKPTATLTVTTCYPFYYIGDAPERYILVATLTSSKLN